MDNNNFKIETTTSHFIYKNKKYIIKTDHVTYSKYNKFLKNITKENNSFSDLNEKLIEFCLKEIIQKNKYIKKLNKANLGEIMQIINVINKLFLLPVIYSEKDIEKLIEISNEN